MEISNPRRILAVSSEDSTQHLSQVIKDLTGTHPEPASASSLAGTTHTLALKTAYYTASVPIWLDLISDPSEWTDSFLLPEAKEVLDVLGGVVVVFAIPPATAGKDVVEKTKDVIKNVAKVVKEGLGGWEWDGVGLGVGVGEAGMDELDVWDNACADCGLEFVHVAAGGHVAAGAEEKRNEFGEKSGIPRVLEALESNDWDLALGGDDGLDGSDFGDFENPPRARKPLADDKDEDDADLDPESLDFGFDREDFAGLRKAIWSAGQEDDEEIKGKEELGDEDVKQIEGMMRKLQAVRDMSAGLPEEQRKKMAAKAVGEVMKEL